MLRQEFDEHPLWATLDNLDDYAQKIRDEAHPADISPLEVVQFYASHIRSFRHLTSTSITLFSAEMMQPVQDTMQGAASYLANRVSNGPGYSFVSDAALSAERALMYLGPWPRPYARGGQVTAINTLYENLLELQRESVSALEKSHEVLRAEIRKYTADIGARRQVVSQEIATFSAEAGDIAGTVTAQKTRIDEVVANGLSTISEVRETSVKSYKEWLEKRAQEFKSEVAPSIARVGEDADAAEEILGRLKEAESEYVALSAEVAAGELAKDFAKEARFGRNLGIGAYVTGFVFLGMSAVPLLFLLQPGADPSWEQLVVRLSIGVVGASAATVVIRLGARFISSANRSKRMELELRAFGPFLANVTDSKVIDSARIDLVSRTFGVPEVEARNREDAIPVSAVSQLLDLVTKIAK